MVDKDRGYIGSSGESTGKRANLAAASSAAKAKTRDTAAGSDGRDGRAKPSEEELTAYAQDLDRNMIEKARTSFRNGLVASLVVVVIVVALIVVAKNVLGVGA